MVAQLSTVVSANRLNEFRAQFSREARPRRPNTTGPTFTVTGLGTTGRVSFLSRSAGEYRFNNVADKGVIRFNAGLFYSRTPALLIVSLFTSNGQAQLQLTFTATSPGAPTFPNNLAAAPTGVSIPRSNVNIFYQVRSSPRLKF